MAIEQPNIRFGGAMAIQRAAQGFVDRLAPSDRIAVAGFGIGAPATPFTSDRERIKKALQRMVGQKQIGRSIDVGHNIALVEAQAIDRGDREMLAGMFTAHGVSSLQRYFVTDTARAIVDQFLILPEGGNVN